MSYRLLPFSIASEVTVGIFSTLGISPARGTLSFFFNDAEDGGPITPQFYIMDSAAETSPTLSINVFNSELSVPDNAEVYIYNYSHEYSAVAPVSGYALFTPAVPVGTAVDGPSSSSTTYTY